MLTTAMGINRPSLYAMFGNKEQLFERALRVATVRPRWRCCAATEGTHGLRCY